VRLSFPKKMYFPFEFLQAIISISDNSTLGQETNVNCSFLPQALIPPDSLFFLWHCVVLFLGSTLNGFIFYILKNEGDIKHDLIYMNLSISDFFTSIILPILHVFLRILLALVGGKQPLVYFRVCAFLANSINQRTSFILLISTWVLRTIQIGNVTVNIARKYFLSSVVLSWLLGIFSTVPEVYSFIWNMV
jgi:hypothetical protein